jgi:cytochrome c oxidase subunit IV
MSTHSLHAHDQHISLRTLYTVYGALLVLMLLTFGAAHIDMGPFNFAVAMGIATVKMVLIILYFMHVRFSSKLVWVFSFAAFFWLLIFVIGTLNDYFTRGFLNVPGK